MTSDTYPQPRSAGQAETDSVDTEALLEALDDDSCRRILQELRNRSLTAQEVSGELNIPQSTAYRKLNLLTEAGLLSAEVRLAPAENNPTEYRTVADGATISVAPDGECEVTLCPTEQTETASGYSLATDD